MQPRETSPSFDLKPKNSSFPSSVSNLISQIGTKWVVGGALGLLLFGIFSTVVISFVAGPQGVGGIFKSHLLELADSAIKEGLNNPLGYKPLKYHTWKHKKYRATLVLVKFIGTNAFGGQVKAKGWVVVYKDKESKKEKTELVEIHNDSGLPDSFNDSDADVFFGRSSIKVSALPID